ncbi:sensor histidine kinase [Paenibacillus sp. strain BS8-2]
MMMRPFKQKNSLKLKVVLSLCAILGAVFFVAGYMTYSWHVQIARDEIKGQFSRTVDQVLYSVEQKVQSSYKLSNQMIFHPQIIETLNKKAVTYYDTTAVQDILDQMMLAEPQLLSINLFDLEGHQFRPANSFLFRPLNETAHTAILDKLENSNGELIWFKDSVDELLAGSPNKGDAIIAARWMKSNKLETFGVLVFVFHNRYFINELQHVMNHAEGSLELYNNEGELLYGDAPSGTDDPYITSDSISDKTGFKLRGRTSLAQLEDKSSIIFQISLYSGVVSIILSSILLVLTMQRLFTPMTRLIEGMRKVRAGQMDTQIEVSTSDDMAFLGESFNSMVRNINSLIEEVYEKQLREREAELKAIQAQLNPHFLYNTLDMVYWRLYLQNDHDNARIIIALSEMLRYSLEPAGGETTVKDELRQLSNYLNIQQGRFEDSLHVTIETDEETMNCRILPLLLQPVVENVFVHAFQLEEIEEKRVSVRLKRIEGQLVAEVEDNGSGMPVTILEELREGRTQEERDKHIGLRGVIRRIELVYGAPYRLDIESTKEKGTLIRLILPYQTIEDTKGGDGAA